MKPEFRTATVVSSVAIALAWLIVSIAVPHDRAALALGFIPARLSGADVPWAALPAWLTPLSSTLVHAGFLHVGFNLLIFAWMFVSQWGFGIAIDAYRGAVLDEVGAFGAAMASFAGVHAACLVVFVAWPARWGGR